MNIFSFIFIGIVKFYTGHGLVYVYYNYLRRKKLTWEEKDDYGMSKYGILAGSLGFIIFFALFLLLI